MMEINKFTIGVYLNLKAVKGIVIIQIISEFYRCYRCKYLYTENIGSFINTSFILFKYLINLSVY